MSQDTTVPSPYLRKIDDDDDDDDDDILFTAPNVSPPFVVTVVNSTAVNVSWQV